MKDGHEIMLFSLLHLWYTQIMPWQARLDVLDAYAKLCLSLWLINLLEVEELGLSAAEIARHLVVATSSITRAIEKIVEGTGQPGWSPTSLGLGH